MEENLTMEVTIATLKRLFPYDKEKESVEEYMKTVMEYIYSEIVDDLTK